jgi:hypothetical protein
MDKEAEEDNKLPHQPDLITNNNGQKAYSVGGKIMGNA